MPVYFECKIDETQQGDLEDEVQEHLAQKANTVAEKLIDGAVSLARSVIDMREQIPLGYYHYSVKSDLMKMLSFLAYACEHPSRRKRKPMDVAQMIETWLPLIKKLAMAHDVDEKDLASSQLDDLLLPVIGAPVAQIREFYRGLTDGLKTDPEVPWAVWKMFDFWGENVLDKIHKEETVGLKTELAKRIAERSMEAVPREDWVMSMVGALQWRSPEKLKQVEKALDAGHQPRVRGKESCLFLQVGESVEVML